MRRRKRVICWLLCLLAAASVLIGCDGRGADTELDISDWQSWRIGTPLAWSSDYYLSEQVRIPHLYLYDSIGDCIMALRFGYVDAIAVDALYAYSMVAEYSDLVIQEAEGKLLHEIISERGIEGFLEVENKINSELNPERSVIATGGSVIYGKDAMEHLSEIGTVVYLKLPYDVLVRRLGNLKDRGVVLKEGQTLKGLYEERTPLYEKYAQLTVDEETLGIRETVELVAEALKKE